MDEVARPHIIKHRQVRLRERVTSFLLRQCELIKVLQKVLYLITTRHAELELCNFSWKLIEDTKNPGISWQHLA